jgi:hypothetical protein
MFFQMVTRLPSPSAMLLSSFFVPLPLCAFALSFSLPDATTTTTTTTKWHKWHKNYPAIAEIAANYAIPVIFCNIQENL